MNFISFFEQFLRNPAQTGAVIASSHRLCQLMVEEARVPDARVVMEFGTGTGSVTREILRQKHSKADFIGFEINETFAEATRRRCPGAEIISACATTAVDVLRQKELGYCDTIVSGLPWATFSRSAKRLLTAAESALRNRWYFCHLCLRPRRHCTRLALSTLSKPFPSLRRARLSRGNMPPAWSISRENKA